MNKKTSWDFVEKYFPGYSTSSIIAEYNDLLIIIEEEEGSEEILERYPIFDGEVGNAQEAYNLLLSEIYEAAIYGYLNKNEL
jgi:hypothetical protein